MYADTHTRQVPNFLSKGNFPFLAVKKFSYSLSGGVAEHAEDFKRFKLELFISSLVVHPNVVCTYGAIPHHQMT